MSVSIVANSGIDIQDLTNKLEKLEKAKRQKHWISSDLTVNNKNYLWQLRTACCGSPENLEAVKSSIRKLFPVVKSAKNFELLHLFVSAVYRIEHHFCNGEQIIERAKENAASAEEQSIVKILEEIKAQMSSGDQQLSIGELLVQVQHAKG